MDPFSAGRPASRPKAMKLGGGGGGPRPPAGSRRMMPKGGFKPRPPVVGSNNNRKSSNDSASPWFSEMSSSTTTSSSSSANVFGSPAPNSDSAPAPAYSSANSASGPQQTAGSYRSTVGQVSGYGSAGVNRPGSSQYQRQSMDQEPRSEPVQQPSREAQGPGMFNVPAPGGRSHIKEESGGIAMSGKMGDGSVGRPSQGGSRSNAFMTPGDFSAPPPAASSSASGMMTGKIGQPSGGGTSASGPRTSVASSFDGNYDFSTEPPLLEELGVDMRRVWFKTVAVVNPFKPVDVTIMKAQDSDLAGPLIFACTLGSLLMFQGKLQFGYVFGLMVFGSLALSILFNLMAQDSQVTFFRTMSILGYCMLPTIGLAAISIVVKLTGWVGLFLGLVSVVWCVYVSATFFEHALNMPQHRWLIAYPVFIFYSCFVMLAVF